MAIITREQITAVEPQQTATLRALDPGVAGIRQTLNYMVAFAKQYRKYPDIRRLAEQIIVNVPQKDAVGEVRAIFNYVRDNIRYTQDIRDVETLKSPDATVFSGQGDCDDKSLLVATLLESVGYATRFVAVGMNQPGAYEHVFTEVKLGTRWIALDTTEPVEMGWSPPNPQARLERHV